MRQTTSELKKTTTEMKEEAGKISEKLTSVETKVNSDKAGGRNLYYNQMLNMKNRLSNQSIFSN